MEINICVLSMAIMALCIMSNIQITEYTRFNVILLIVVNVIGVGTIIISTMSLVFGVL